MIATVSPLIKPNVQFPRIRLSCCLHTIKLSQWNCSIIVDTAANELVVPIITFHTYVIALDVAPNAPSSLQAQAGNACVSLLWQGGIKIDLAGFHVYQGTEGSDPPRSQSTLFPPQST